MSDAISPSLAMLMDAAAAVSEAGDFGRAEPLFRQIVAMNPRKADAWHMLAMIAVRAGRSAEAIDLHCFKRALKERPTHAESHYNLGKLHTKLGQNAEAERSYRRATTRSRNGRRRE